jgi:CRP-like cAMP-binding protein
MNALPRHAESAHPTAEACGWPARRARLNAVPVPADQALPMLAALWSGARLGPVPDEATWARLAARMDFVRVGSGAKVIEQDEAGSFLAVLLEGAAVIEHHGEPAPDELARGEAAAVRAPLRLAQVRPGDVMGEMSLLDAGPRSSACVTRSPCLLGVLELPALQALMLEDAPLASSLLAALARRLSLRLRQADARLAVLLSAGD